MNRNRIYIIVFIALACIAAWFYINNSTSTIKPELREFAVKDTASIDKIFMADRKGKTALLKRQSPGTWTINDHFEARQDAINTLLYTIANIEVRSPVGKNLYNNTMKLLSANSVKVELYSKDQILKTIYVGHATMDNLGTFMYLEGSSVPFIMHIPGFNGYLTPRFFTSEADWRKKSVFAYAPAEIKSVEMKYETVRDSSFQIVRQNDSTFVLKVNGVERPAIRSKLMTYILHFKNISYEKVEDAISSSLKDSLLFFGPFASVKVEPQVGGAKTAIMYRMPVNSHTMTKEDAAGKPLPFDRDKLFLKVTGDTSWFIGQYFTFDKLLKTPAYFTTR
jgi:hypothetical protein